MSFWYLATPYSKYKQGIHAAYMEAAAQAALFVKAGIPVFSPIAHTHPVASHGHINPLDHEIWLPADRAFMDAARGLIVCRMEGWKESYGIAQEVSAFEAMKKPVYYMDPGEVPQVILDIHAVEQAKDGEWVEVSDPANIPSTNPKDAIGRTKPPMHAVPPIALLTLGRVMADGERKYGLMNYRDKEVSAAVYYDAFMRHVLSWWDGENTAEDSGLHHLGHAMACLAIIIDAESVGKLVDDRPIKGQAASYIKQHTKEAA